MKTNPNCDGGRCRSETGEVRMLPISINGSNLILIVCRDCYAHEILWRIDRNKVLAADAAFDLPAWTDLKPDEAT